nr:hypothetical protein [Ningiella sp. W23]
MDTNPALTSGVIDYFNTLKTEQLTESGAQKIIFTLVCRPMSGKDKANLA